MTIPLVALILLASCFVAFGDESPADKAMPAWAIEAKMMNNVTLREAAELRVTLDLPPEKIRRVMFFESGFTWMGQHGLG